jgi:hypothetical protein
MWINLQVPNILAIESGLKVTCVYLGIWTKNTIKWCGERQKYCSDLKKIAIAKKDNRMSIIQGLYICTSTN